MQPSDATFGSNAFCNDECSTEMFNHCSTIEHLAPSALYRLFPQPQGSTTCDPRRPLGDSNPGFQLKRSDALSIRPSLPHRPYHTDPNPREKARTGPRGNPGAWATWGAWPLADPFASGRHPLTPGLQGPGRASRPRPGLGARPGLGGRPGAARAAPAALQPTIGNATCGPSKPPRKTQGDQTHDRVGPPRRLIR